MNNSSNASEGVDRGCSDPKKAVTVGSFVVVRGRKYNGDNQLMEGTFRGVVKEIKRDGQCLVLDNGWHMNLDHGDELVEVRP